MKYNSEHIESLISALQNGSGRVKACKCAGISYRTLIRWLDANSQFCLSVKKAEAIGSDSIKDLQIQKIINDKSWQSAAWWLERNYPNEFRNRQDVSINSVKATIDQLFPSEAELDEAANYM